jgi:hypothetical protein
MYHVMNRGDRREDIFQDDNELEVDRPAAADGWIGQSVLA